MANLLILKGTAGDFRGQEFAFPAPAQVIMGRSRSCALRLPGDATVSRQHCLIEIDESGAWIQDLGSLNGTYVNGEKIGQRPRMRQDDATMIQPPRCLLHEGDELRVCNNAFLVELLETANVAPGTATRNGQGSDPSLLVLCS